MKQRFGQIFLPALAAALAALIGTAQAQPGYPPPPPGYGSRPAGGPAGNPQEKLMARRAAIADAQRQLAEIIKGTRLDSQTYVRDFVTQSDEISSSFEGIIRGVQPSGEARYSPDGVVEVDATVRVADVSRLLGRNVPYYSDEFFATGTGAMAGAHRAQERLMARRAAILDAQRQLAEMIQGVRIDSSTYVRDFVTQSDEISSRLNAVMMGAEVVETRYMPDGTVEVDMAIPAHRVEWMLGQRVSNPNDVFRVTGTGAPGGPAAPAPIPVATPAPDPYDFRTLTITATGNGACPPNMGPTPQGKAMAQRAALMDARRNLGENILGVRIDSSTYVRDFVTVSDEISSRFQGFLRGSREVSSREVEPCLFEVTVEITLTELGDIVLSGQQAKGYTPQPSYAPSSSSSYAPPAPSGYGSSGYGSSAPSSTPLPGSPYSGPRYNAPQPGGAGVSAPAQPGPIHYNEVPGSLAP